MLGERIARLAGPILVLGASGFIGANLMRLLRRHRSDVFGTASRLPAWRLEGVPDAFVLTADLLIPANLRQVLDHAQPSTVFDCISYGAYSFQREADLIYRTNVDTTAALLEELSVRGIRAYVHAGSSSEYGTLSAGPREDSPMAPNSHYAVTKVAAASLIHYMGKHRRLPCVNLRLYSVYGPLEDPARLVPTLVRNCVEGRLPPFVDPRISRDFVYIDDACEAFVDAALMLKPDNYGDSINIGSGRCTTIGEIATLAKDLFAIGDPPEFSMVSRDWDVQEWYADAGRAREHLGWSARTSLAEGLRATAEWFRTLPDRDAYLRSSKEHGPDQKHSLSAIIACYLDAQAIPIMYRRLSETFQRIGVDYEIIFVNDCSPDDSEEVIRSITANDRRVIGISHSRNFGSQAAFRSGMELSSKNACVLLDGDLQDPPELIEQFLAKWQAGYDVVYGRRVKREAPWYMSLSYKLFYRLFDAFSYVRIPHDAGDFSLMDRRVVRCLLKFPERDLFLRGVRAFAGFRQAGVDYVRPERMFGRSTNNLLKNLGWAKKGILSFSNTPLNVLTSFSFVLFSIVLLVGSIQVIAKLLFPELTPKGLTTVLLVQMFFGSTILLAIGLLGEYIAKIFEEVKRRPLFLRRSIVLNGEVRDATDR
jgi:dolichol-phosphate mannosyltransferase